MAREGCRRDVERLLAVRPAAIAEAQRLCPELLRADLVRLGDGTWLDVLTWSCADGEERLMARAEEFDALHAMHELLEDAEQVGRGEIMAAPRDDRTGVGRRRRR